VHRKLIELGAADMACKMIFRYDFYDIQEFRAYADRASALTVDDVVLFENSADFLELNIPETNILLARNEAELEVAASVLLDPTTDVLGLDVEWRPFQTGSPFSR
jgi:hypothetical protein